MKITPAWPKVGTLGDEVRSIRLLLKMPYTGITMRRVRLIQHGRKYSESQRLQP